MKIVVVEDELKILKGIAANIPKISDEYVVVGQARNGLEAVEVIFEENPDLVITDINMPTMNGLEMMKQIKKRGMNCKFIILSGYADFQFAQEAIKLGSVDYLLKPITIEDLSNALKDVEASLLHENEKNKFMPEKYNLSELLYRVITLHAQDSKDYMNELSMRIPCDTTLCILLIKSDYTIVASQKDNIISVIDRRFSTSDQIMYCLCTTDIDKELMLFIVVPDSVDIIAALEDIKTDITEIKNERIVFSCKIFDDIRMIYEVTHRVRDNMNWSISLKENILIYDELVNNFMCKKFVYPIEIERIIINKINSGKFDGIKEDIGRFLDYIGQDMHFYTDIREALLCLTSAILYAIRRNSYGLYEEINHLEILDRIKKSLSIHTYSNMMMNIISHYKLYSTNIRYCKHPIINKVLNIIMNEYNKDISLDSVSSQLNITSEYLSSLFSKEIGMKFTTFLTQYRIEQAKQLLREGSLKIYTISEKVGYNDVGYFCRVFKKYTGLSPGDFAHSQE